MLKRWRWAWAWTIGTVLLAGSASAQDPQTPAKCDPAVAACYTFEGWLITERAWTPTGAEPRDLVGGRLQAEIRWHRWRWAARVDSTGIPGEYQERKLETIRSVEVHAAAAWGPICPAGAVSIGPAVGIGAAVETETDAAGQRAWMPKRFTGGIGARASGPGWWAYVVVGQNQALRGVAVTAVWQIAVNDRLATVGTAAVGSRTWTATTGVAVRFK